MLKRRPGENSAGPKIWRHDSPCRIVRITVGIVRITVGRVRIVVRGGFVIVALDLVLVLLFLFLTGACFPELRSLRIRIVCSSESRRAK